MNGIDLLADAMGVQSLLWYLGACRCYQHRRVPLNSFTLLHQLLGPLNVGVGPETNADASDPLQLWRLNPVAIGDVSLQRHEANS